MKTFRRRTVVLSTAVLCSLLACASASAATVLMGGSFWSHESDEPAVSGSATALVTFGRRAVSVGPAKAIVRAETRGRHTFYEAISYRCGDGERQSKYGHKVTVPLRRGRERTVHVPAARATCPRGSRIDVIEIYVAARKGERKSWATLSD